MSEQMQNTPSKFGRFLRGLARLVLFALIVAVVVAAIYYAIPYVYSYTVLPVQNNRVVIDHLQESQTQMQEELTGQLAEQRERIAQLETDLAAEREARSELEHKLTQQAEAISAQATTQTELETNLASQETATQAELTERLEVQAQTIATLEKSVDALDAFLTDLDKTVAKVEQAVSTPETEVVNLQRQTLVLQASQAVLKARLHLIENNPGLAKQSLEQTGLALAQLESLISSEQEEDLAEIQTQSQAVITAIEEQPFIVVQELEILWELLQRFSESE